MAIWSTDRWRELSSLSAGFIFATIWFDMMFDVKLIDCCLSECSLEEISSKQTVISAYYSQVTWYAPPPMRILLGFVMVMGIISSYYSWKRHPFLWFLQPLLLAIVSVMAAISTFPACYWLGHNPPEPEKFLGSSCRVFTEHGFQLGLVFLHILLHLFCVKQSNLAKKRN
uniref:Uncharacterized protein n=1 Tax=Paramoeba aestuarina TaxID=180227 RepID=A0A7S4K175_9EUKA|mmetsp:Transcript_14641/g.22853  ORF Transcript_14641/g.22853 Transcript_14641/m.22853 type:complete len:170 (+) Transcript_14641:289-798(+)